MKFSEKWLREWVNPPVNTDALADQLTFMGLEVDGIESAAPGFEGVVVARIVDIHQHPDADRLRVCTIDCGNSDLLQVVCGAANARAGLVTALAQVGGKLPDGTALKKAKLRGVVSMGMLCSAAELNLSDEASGILELPEQAPVGTDLLDYLELDDTIIDIDLTPDRGDCLSIRGLARDLCAKNDLPLQLREINDAPVQGTASWSVQVHEGCACVRYSGRMLSRVSLSGRSPSWMIERLRRSGIRSINPAVDVTNYVMLELGQPMHAFDADKLQGDIQVRLARDGERLTLLDGRDVALEADTTIIADDRGPIGIAGIMGGNSTGVDETTTNVFLESALFLPELIAGKPRRYSSHTESAHRFERGVDPAGQVEALEYATGLLRTISGGQAGPVSDWQAPERLPIRSSTELRQSRLARVLGISVPRSSVDTIFTRLGICHKPADEGWLVTAPSYRYDLAIEEDYVEEVARVLGYESLPRTYPSHKLAFRAVPENRVAPIDVKRLLVARNYQEVVTYSFVEANEQQLLRPDLQALPLANPLSSELGVMRTTLIGGLINTLQYNRARQAGSMSLFETGLRFVANSQADAASGLDRYIAVDHGMDQQSDVSVQQQTMLAGLVVGRRQLENWNADTDQADFFAVKADLEALFQQSNGVAVKFIATDLAMLHPGQRAAIEVDGALVGYVGALNPVLQSALDLSVVPLVFEVSLHAFHKAQIPKANLLSRYPQVRRDIALLVDEAVSYQSILDVVQQASSEILREVRVFDVYQGDKLPVGKKSLAIGLILQDFSRTLEDRDVEQVVSGIVTALDKACGAVLRV